MKKIIRFIAIFLTGCIFILSVFEIPNIINYINVYFNIDFWLLVLAVAVVCTAVCSIYGIGYFIWFIFLDKD